MHHQEGPRVKMTAKDKPETYLITIKPKTVGLVAEQFSRVLLPSCSPPRRPSPVTSLALSVWVSPWTINFQVLDKSPLSGLGRGPLPATLTLIESTHDPPIHLRAPWGVPYKYLTEDERVLFLGYRCVCKGWWQNGDAKKL